jgi:hypothetical protein
MRRPRLHRRTSERQPAKSLMSILPLASPRQRVSGALDTCARAGSNELPGARRCHWAGVLLFPPERHLLVDQRGDRDSFCAPRAHTLEAGIRELLGGEDALAKKFYSDARVSVSWVVATVGSFPLRPPGAVIEAPPPGAERTFTHLGGCSPLASIGRHYNVARSAVIARGDSPLTTSTSTAAGPAPGLPTRNVSREV